MNGEFKYHLVNWVDLTERKRLKANMEFYLSEVTRAQEEERKRIAREIHDESIQSLAALALGIDATVREKERLPKDIIQRLKGLRAETNSILDGLRRFSHELRPGVIDQVGLVPALEILTEELNKENRVKTSLEVAGSERRLMPETELALFRIAQEALRNVRRHSRATQAAIRLKFTRSKVKLTVSDDGRGFELPGMLSDFAAEGKLGLIGMQERARLLGGKLLVRSGLGRGTTVVVEVADIQGMKG
ncbi:Signal transduction histidine-protein kinase/phosphatase DegS [subsurface metagenome]